MLNFSFKWHLSFFLFTLLAFSGSANATQVKFLFAPGGLFSFMSTADGDFSGAISGDAE